MSGGGSVYGVMVCGAGACVTGTKVQILTLLALLVQKYKYSRCARAANVSMERCVVEDLCGGGVCVTGKGELLLFCLFLLFFL